MAFYEKVELLEGHNISHTEKSVRKKIRLGIPRPEAATSFSLRIS